MTTATRASIGSLARINDAATLRALANAIADLAASIEDQEQPDTAIAIARRMRRNGDKLIDIAETLNARGFRAPRGGRFHRATVLKLLA